MKNQNGAVPVTYDQPDYLETDLLDEDIKKMFKGKGNYMTFEPLLLQLIKELKKAR